MTEDHLTPARVVQILDENQIEIHELSHLEKCSTCYEWLKAFSALKEVAGNTTDIIITTDTAQPDSEISN